MKIIKRVLLLITICLSTSCIYEKEVTTIINPINDLELLYGQSTYLYDVISITDGYIIDTNYLLDTEEIGKKEITINYKNNNNKKEAYKYTYKVIDNINPILSVPKNIYSKLGEDINLMKKTFCGDNADRNLSCTYEGEYNINELGDYPITFTAKDESGNTVTRNSTLHIVKSLNTTSNEEGTPLSYYIKNYQDKNTSFGIDISTHQKEIDFNKVKASGIEFVMIRIGFGPDNEGNMTTDKYFIEYYTKAKEAGLKVGIYLFSYATTMDEIDIETNWIINMLKDKPIDLPIAYDWESWNTFYSCHMNFRDLNKQAEKFLNNLKNANYDVYMYSSKSKLVDIWELDNYPIWLAQYNKEVTYEKDYSMWQITDTGIVDGVDTLVDIDILHN